MLMQDPYRDLIAVGGEDLSITSHDATETVTLRGMYDRRIYVGEIAGSEVRDPDFRVGVVADDLPPWVGPGARLDIRADALQVVALEPDGQGLTYLVCRAAR